jgi:hypothetical protein
MVGLLLGDGVMGRRGDEGMECNEGYCIAWVQSRS